VKKFLKETWVTPYPVFRGYADISEAQAKSGPHYPAMTVRWHTNTAKVRKFLEWRQESLAAAGYVTTIEEANS
jgi:hypothetical protein